MSGAQAPENEVVLLEPASEANVDLLVRWTLDPVAQGPYKRVPESRAVPIGFASCSSENRHGGTSWSECFPTAFRSGTSLATCSPVRRAGYVGCGNSVEKTRREPSCSASGD